MPRHTKPMDQKILDGTVRKARDAGRTGTFPLLKKAPQCPESIQTPKAREAWQTIVGQFAKTNRLALEDISGLELAFRSFEHALKIDDALSKLDALEDTSKYRALLGERNKAAAFFTGVLQLFGFSSKGRENLPNARAELNIQNKKPLQELMTGK